MNGSGRSFRGDSRLLRSLCDAGSLLRFRIGWGSGGMTGDLPSMKFSGKSVEILMRLTCEAWSFISAFLFLKNSLATVASSVFLHLGLGGLGGGGSGPASSDPLTENPCCLGRSLAQLFSF